MYIVKYSERVHMVRMHELASASPPYDRVPNIYIVKYSERVHMARMHELASASPPYEEFRIFYDIHSIIFLLYTL